ncbi:MAG: carboxypeptidase-like regulatory domain-containing protein [Methanomassiliicoccales archaeon]|nr:carboxypeptidase-like regulatory domain-containing protein [Methanomassiliicoccales archaeon]
MRKTAALAIVAALLLALLPGITAPVLAAAGDPGVSGTVADDRGSPLQGVEVIAISVPEGMVRSAVTDAAGTYNISLSPGTYNVSASLALHSANITYYLLEVQAEVVGLDFEMSPLNGTLTGFAFVGEVPLAGVAVTLSGGGLNYTANTTSPFGRYDILGIRPGIYVAKAEKKGYWTALAPDPVFVSSAQMTSLNFTLVPQPARVFGVASLGGVAEPGVKVQLLSQGSLMQEALTDSLGNYSFDDVPSGDYTLLFVKEGLEDKSVPISLQPFAELRVDVSMVRQPMQGGEGFIDGLDLTHSMMVVALVVAILLMLFALFIRARAADRPEILAKEEEEPEEERK